MAILTANSRRDVEVHSFPIAVSILLPLLALGLQAYLPLRFPRFAILDLPLIVTVFFAVARRNPISGTLTGAMIGLIQDALTHRPIGINGISKALIGYLAASIGVRIDVDNHGTRLILNFGFTLLQSSIYLLITRHLLGLQDSWGWLHEILRAVANALLAVIVFALVDRTRRDA